MISRRDAIRSPWTLLVVALGLIAVLNLVVLGGSSSSVALGADNAKPNGGLALNLWLQRDGYHVTTTSTEPNLFQATPTGRTVMLLADHVDVPDGRATAYLNWVTRGGRLIIASNGSTGSTLLAALQLGIAPASAGSIRVVQPVLRSRPVSRLTGVASSVLESAAGDLVVAETDSGAVLIEHHQGAGAIWVLTAPELLENGQIAVGENRRLLLNLAGPPGTTVVLDEFVPSVADNQVTDWLTQTVWGVVVLFGIGVLVLYRWLSGWRLGPVVTPLRLRHRAAVEYVISLAGLLRRGKGRQEAVETYQRVLQREVRRRHGDLSEANLPREQRERIEGLLAARPILTEAELIARSAAIVEETNAVRDARA